MKTHRFALARVWRKNFPTITVAQLMKHRAGLNVIRNSFPTTQHALDTFANVEKLEAWVLGGAFKQNPPSSSYHGVSRGIFVDLLVSKVDGRRVKDFIRDEIIGMLGLGDLISMGCATPEHSARLIKCYEPMFLAVYELYRTFGHFALRYVWFQDLGEREYAY